MAYETNSATDIDDLMTKLDTFLVANGWTQDQLDVVTNNEAAWHKGTIYVQFRWDSSGRIGMYQSTGYTGGQHPGNHAGDSGNGIISSSITSQRRITGIGTGPFTAYHFFLDTAPDNVHIVLEWQPEYFRHISFGSMIKIGTWTGGEYATCSDWNTSGANASDILNTSHLVLFDNLHGNSVSNVGTLHVEGLSFEPGASKWGVFWAASTAAGTDRAGNARVIMAGCLRDGPLAELFCGIRATPSNGFVPMYPVWIFARDRTVSPEDDIFLGTIPNLRGLNIRFIEPGEIITFGTDDWMCFPWTRKANLGSTSQESKYQGIAIKKVP